MKKTLKYIIPALIVIILMSSCRRQEIEPTATPIPPAKSTPTPTEYYDENPTNKPVFADITDFESGNNAYTSGFSNFREQNADTSELTAQIAEIPDLSSKGFFMSGNNVSDSLLMYLTKNIIALANTQYTVQIDFDIATNIKSNINNESASNNAVYVKAGASSVPFQLILDEKDFFRSNWDIGSLDGSGADGRTIGTADKVNSQDAIYQYKSFSQSFKVLTADDGLICILIAAETNIPDFSSLYFDNIIVEISQQ